MAAVTAPKGASWLIRAYHEIQRGRHLVIHGNVDDLVRWDSRYLPFPDTLADFLTVAGFDVVLRFDLVDGITYHDEASRQFVRPYLSAEAVPTDQPAPSLRPAGPAADGDRQARLASAADVLEQRILNAGVAEPRTAADMLAVARRLSAQSERSCALVWQSADLLVGQPAQLAGDHLTQIAYVRQLIAAGRGGSGARLVFVARDLATLPAWLHRDNPTVAAVLADRPGAAERAAYLAAQVATYHEAAALPAVELDEATNVLANLTDGMTVIDLGALAVTSRVARIPPTAPHRLVARHRFGLRDDPWEQLDIERIRQAESLLRRRVIGQEPAVRAVTDVLVNARVGLDFGAGGDRAGGRPKGVFFFVGPTGVGKTELAKALAELVFDDETALRRFDMSEYSQEHTSERLIGAPPGFVGHEHGGTLTNWVLERPFSVLLFDEIEKAHEKIMDKFLQIIDDGRLTDGQGRTAHFSHSIVIFTSNIGAGDLGRAATGPAMSYEAIHDHFHRAVAEHFSDRLRRPELLGRLGSGVVVFDVLRESVTRDITAKFLEQLRAAADARGYDLVLDPAIGRAVADEITKRGIALGARQIRSPLLEEWVRVPLNRWILEHQPPPGTRIFVHRSDDSPPFVVEAMEAAA